MQKKYFLYFRDGDVLLLDNIALETPSWKYLAFLSIKLQY